MKKVYKVIIDTDPGVDDTNALIYALHDSQFDIKLFTIAWGNIPIKNATRNMCHLLDIFKKDIPVVEGKGKRFGKNTEDASFLHTVQGLGGYIPPKTTKTQPKKMDAADAMYEILKQNPKEVTLIVLGPHTNVAELLIKHPDAKDLVKNILMMGGAPKGIQTNPNHNSFNIRTDAPAFKQTVDSKIPTVMVPSSIGRDEGYFTEEQVEQLKNTNDVGRFLAKTFETYWEPNYPDKRIATNDLSAIYALTMPKLYKTKKCFMEVDEETGKTTPHYNRKGKFKVVTGLNRKKFMKMVFEKLEKLNGIKIPELDVTDEEKSKDKKTKTTTSNKTSSQNTTKKSTQKTVKTVSKNQKTNSKSSNKSKKEA